MRKYTWTYMQYLLFTCMFSTKVICSILVLFGKFIGCMCIKAFTLRFTWAWKIHNSHLLSEGRENVQLFRCQWVFPSVVPCLWVPLKVLPFSCKYWDTSSGLSALAYPCRKEVENVRCIAPKWPAFSGFGPHFDIQTRWPMVVIEKPSNAL